MKRKIYLTLSAIFMLFSPIIANAQIPDLTPEQIAQLSAMQGGSRLAIDSPTSASTPSSTTDQERVYVVESNTDTRDELIVDEDVSLAIYGRDMFARENLSFAPSFSIPTPSNYIVSTGDELIVVIWGAAEAEYKLKVSPEGTITVPRVGVINVGGLTIEAAESLIKSKFERSFNGLDIGETKIKVTLGNFRSINVNIVGEALVPGSYTLPSLATVFNAIYAAGGVSDIGSLRDIKLYRAGKLIGTLDAYDYLINGDSSIDQRLEDGDLIVVAPYRSVVEIIGNVRRPMLYELGREQNLQEIIDYAGGFTGDAYSETLTVSRSAGGKQLTLHTIQKPDYENFILFDKDVVTIGKVVDKYENRVTIEGAVWRAGDYELSEDMSTVKALVQSAQGLRDDAFAGRAHIIRTRPDLSIEFIPINLAAILMDTEPDIELQMDDKIVVTSINDMQEGRTVTITGEVNVPTVVNYGEGMTLNDLILMARGLKESASLARIEIARRVVDQYKTVTDDVRAEIMYFTVPEDLTLNKEVAEFKLKPFDIVFVRKSPGYINQRIVTVHGEVNFDGNYVLQKAGSRLSDIVNLAGGLTDGAYPTGATLQRLFTDVDARRESSLAALADVARREALNREEKLSRIEEIYTAVGSFYNVGIELEKALENPGCEYDIILREGDKLFIPTFSNTITISGAIYYPTTTTYLKNLTVRDYIKYAGGYSIEAKRKPFVIEMNGMVRAAKMSYRPEPGAQIIVPYRRYVEPLDAQTWITVSAAVTTMASVALAALK